MFLFSLCVYHLAKVDRKLERSKKKKNKKGQQQLDELVSTVAEASPLAKVNRKLEKSKKSKKKKKKERGKKHYFASSCKRYSQKQDLTTERASHHNTRHTQRRSVPRCCLLDCWQHLRRQTALFRRSLDVAHLASSMGPVRLPNSKYQVVLQSSRTALCRCCRHQQSPNSACSHRWDRLDACWEWHTSLRRWAWRDCPISVSGGCCSQVERRCRCCRHQKSPNSACSHGWDRLDARWEWHIWPCRRCWYGCLFHVSGGCCSQVERRCRCC